MIKFKDEANNTIAILNDESSEPELIEDKRKRSKKKIASELGVYQPPLPQTQGQIIPILSSTKKKK